MIERDDVLHVRGPSGYMEALLPIASIPAIEARIAWSRNALSGRVIHVLVTNDEEEWQRADDFDSVGGAWHRDWMRPIATRSSPPVGMIPDHVFDPIGTFGMLLAAGFATKGALREALKQFSKIDDCGWARRMLFALDRELQEGDLANP